MAERYIGIENELTSFKNGQMVHYDNRSQNYFDALRAGISYYEKGYTSIRTETGNGYYCDGSELEIVTPPIAINKGFATRLTDSLMIGRDHVINSLPELKHTGYSMHWNLSEAGNVTDYLFFLAAGVPFSLFTQTPLSKYGVASRSKTGDFFSRRIELLSDSINNEDQIRAAALLLGATSQALRTDDFLAGNHPGFCSVDENGRVLRKVNSRNVLVEVAIPSRGVSGITSAQEYLEKFYHWLRPHANLLGTVDEVRNLEDFVYARKPLEIDKVEEYAVLAEKGLFKNGAYHPAKTGAKNQFSIEMRGNGTQRTVPLEGILLGELARKQRVDGHEINICIYSWSSMICAGKHTPLRKIHLLLDTNVAAKQLSGAERPYLNKVSDVHAELALNSASGIYLLGQTLANLRGATIEYLPSVNQKDVPGNPIKIIFADDVQNSAADADEVLTLYQKERCSFNHEKPYFAPDLDHGAGFRNFNTTSAIDDIRAVFSRLFSFSLFGRARSNSNVSAGTAQPTSQGRPGSRRSGGRMTSS